MLATGCSVQAALSGLTADCCSRPSDCPISRLYAQRRAYPSPRPRRGNAYLLENQAGLYLVDAGLPLTDGLILTAWKN